MSGTTLPLLLRDPAVVYQQWPQFSEFCASALVYQSLYRVRYDEVRIPPDIQANLTDYRATLSIVVLLTEDDPDSVAVVPAVARLLALSPQLDLRILRDDEDPELLQHMLQVLLPPAELERLEESDLPQFFLFDEDWVLRGQWGPRPMSCERRLLEWLRRHPQYEALENDDSPGGQSRWLELMHTLTFEMRAWYNTEFNQDCVREWWALLSALQNEDESDESEK